MAEQLTASEKNINPYDRRYSKMPNPNEDSLRPYREFLHSWKHSKSELLAYIYKFFSGALAGTFIGVLAIHPMIKQSPYALRKILMSFRSSEFLPFDNARLVLKAMAPKYALLGGGATLLGQILSDYYDRAIDSNKVTKYMTLGFVEAGIAGYMLTSWMWFPCAIMGMSIGAILSAGKPTSFLRLRGETGMKAVEYIGKVSAEEKRKHALQEARIMGSSGIILPRN